ncbi:MAG: hypothetical protein II598_05155, partial [Elusimicrobia bacterium]|nr:hypothetical protein [Elusimicrobiota bacterium]
FKYVVKGSIVKVFFSYTAKAKSFDSAYKQFKRDIKNGEIISVKILPSENLKKCWKHLKNRWEAVGNLKEINEQILCEFGKANVVLEFLSLGERNKRQQKEVSKVIDFNSLRFKINGNVVYGNKGTED